MSATLTTDKDYVADWIAGFNPADALGFQAQALEVFRSLGFPDTRHEEWKYTSVLPLLKKGFTPALQQAPDPIACVTQQSLDGQLISLHNGLLTGAVTTAEGLSVTSLASSLADGTASHITGQLADFSRDAFTALNTALFRDGLFIDARKGIHNLHIHHTLAGEMVSLQQRTAVQVHDGATLSLLLTSSSAQETWINHVSEFSVGAGAQLNVIILQDQVASHQVNRFVVKQDKTSLVNFWTISLDGGIIRNNLELIIAGERAEAHMYGLYLLQGNTLVDNHTVADHRVPNCMSNELYKGVLDGSSTGVFNGKIFVRKDAQKTNAFQSNKNILLSPTASVNTKPQLEIFADDVKCSHGATTGRLDPASMFYLRTRGLSPQGAKALLTSAFAGEVIDKLPSALLRSQVARSVASRLSLPFNEPIDF